MNGNRINRALSNLSLAVKLFLAPAFLILCLLFLAVMAYRGMTQQKQAIEDMHTKRFAMYRASADLLTELTRVHEGMFKVMTWSQVGYSEDRIAAAVREEIRRLEQARGSITEALRVEGLLPEEREAYDGLQKQLAEYDTWSQRVMDMASGDIATAAVYMGTADIKFKNLKESLARLQALEIRENDGYFADSIKTYRRTVSIFFIGIGIALIIAIGVTIFVARLIGKPVRKVVEELARITEGEWDLTRRIPVESQDEIGQMTKGINFFVEKLQSLIQKILATTERLSSASKGLTSISEALSVNTQDTSRTTTSVVQTTESASRNVSDISDAAESMSDGVRAVAASIEQMSISLQDVVRHCQDETAMAAAANEQAKSTRELMLRLGQSSQEIGQIVNLIKTIASQTNLLALNANIEAASAGDAGKGFAVVAREVKELAQKTARATDQISSQIEAIQQNTTTAATAMEKISTIIEEINSISRTIVVSTEDLSQTTETISASTGRSSEAAVKIAHNVAESARGLSDVNHDVTRVSQAATSTADQVGQITGSAQGLAELSSDLKQIVAQFKV